MELAVPLGPCKPPCCCCELLLVPIPPWALVLPCWGAVPLCRPGRVCELLLEPDPAAPEGLEPLLLSVLKVPEGPNCPGLLWLPGVLWLLVVPAGELVPGVLIPVPL